MSGSLNRVEPIRDLGQDFSIDGIPQKLIECPCCGKKTNAPPLGMVISALRIPPSEARLLTAIWRGKGQPVMPDRVLAVMYADDPDGGPEPGKKSYTAFKVPLSHLRAKLRDYGILIDNIGYGQGYRLRLAHYLDFVPVLNRRQGRKDLEYG